MKTIFTEYVQQLDPSGEPPSHEHFARVWLELRRLLERELRRRSLWDASPSYLGVFGRPRWWEGPSTVTGPGQDDGLDELVAELYPYVFVDRLGKLLVHLRSKPTIDGLVLLNLRHLLHERQKRHDPLGFRVFTLFHQAVVRAVAAGELVVLEGNERIRNETVLGCRPDSARGQLLESAGELVGEWSDALMPELVNGKGRAREWVIDSLQTFLRRLPDAGVESFTFRALLDPLKRDVRSRWALRFEPIEIGIEGSRSGDVEAEVVPLAPVDSWVDDRESLEKLDRCLAKSIEGLPPDPWRDDLKRLWRDLYRRAQDDDIPSQRKLSDALDLPRRRLSRLLASLGDLVDACRQAQRAAACTARATIDGGGTVGAKRRAEALRQRTGVARRRHGEGEARPTVSWTPGAIYRIAASDPHLVEWVVLDDEVDGIRVVPGDISPLVGPHDMVVPADVDGGPLTLRPTYGIRVDRSTFAGAECVGRLPNDILVRAPERLGSEALPIDDPELAEWVHDIVLPAREVVESAHAVRVEAESRSPTVVSDHGRWEPGRARRWRNVFALAASILLVASFGLTRRVLVLDQEIDRRDEVIDQLEAKLEPRAVGNVPFFQLSLATTRSQNQTIRVPSGAQEVVLLLNVSQLDSSFDAYRLRFVGPGQQDEEAWTSDRLHRLQGERLTVRLPSSLLPPGKYWVDVYGVSEDGRNEELIQTKLVVEVVR